MGKREKKTAKGRIDKYYRLAKEQGYRARSAFKLIQLDKKFNFLDSARCCIDLCAAPGGWLQVASKYMPPNSIIVGVDLAPIKPIPRVITFVEDITTPACRTKIRAEVKDWKADVVLHDGAPNVGTAWIQDAFTQAELVLSSLKLAVEFLAPGGTFVTKIFRSKDYNSLLWVFNQLFTKAEATKPPSSRNVSAEIFVVCTGFLAPKRIDPKLLDPTYVFKDLQPAAATLKEDGSGKPAKLTAQVTNIFHPEKKRRKREGYADGDYTLFKLTPVEDYVLSKEDPIQVLSESSKFDWTSEKGQTLLKHSATTPEIVALSEDLKVLGKKDFKNLLKWRLTLRDEFGITPKPTPAAEEDTEVVHISPLEAADAQDLQIEEELQHLTETAAARTRKERRRANEKRNKEVLKLQLNMTTPMDVGLDDAAGGLADMFDLRTVDSKGKARAFSGVGHDTAEPEEDGSSEDESETLESDGDSDDSEADPRLRSLGASLDELYDDYQNHKLERDAKHKARQARKKKTLLENGEWTGIKSDESDASEEDESDSGDDIVKGSSTDTDSDSDNDDDFDQPVQLGKKRQRNGHFITDLADKTSVQKAEDERARQAAIWYDQAVFKNVPGLDKLLTSNVPASKSPAKDNKRSAASKENFSPPEVLEWSSDEEDAESLGYEEVPMTDFQAEEEARNEKAERLGLNTAESITLASQLVNREKTKAQLMDEGFHRYAFNDKDELPTWFLDDEMRHFRKNVPVTKEAVDILRAKMRALDARPIKKVAEAKARKKMRANRRLSRMQKSADYINENPDISEKEKSTSIAKLMSKATSDPKSKKREVKLVVAKGTNRAISGRPKGVKGRYKMVDSRMKKEMRAEKRIARRDKGRK